MAFTTLDTRFAAPSFAQRFATFRLALAQRAAEARAYRTTVAELSALSDRDLADINLHRAQIAEVAAEAARRA